MGKNDQGLSVCLFFRISLFFQIFSQYLHLQLLPLFLLKYRKISSDYITLCESVSKIRFHQNAYPSNSLRIHSTYPSGCMLIEVYVSICVWYVYLHRIWSQNSISGILYTTQIFHHRVLYQCKRRKCFSRYIYPPAIYLGTFICEIYKYIATSSFVHWDLVFCYALVVWPSFIHIHIGCTRPVTSIWRHWRPSYDVKMLCETREVFRNWMFINKNGNIERFSA